MRTRRPSPEHQEAVARRLASLSEHLAAAREEAAVGDEWWDDHTRVAPRRTPLHVVPEPVPGPGPEPVHAAPTAPAAPVVPTVVPAAVPVPGRHAARRAVPVAALLPETLRGRVAFGPGPVAVVAVLVAAALGWTCWQVVRDDPAPPSAVTPAAAPVGDLVPVGSPAAAAAPPADPASATGAEGAGAGAAVTETVTVDVAGRVRRPGIVVLDAGARVVDAIEAAGGARPAVDLTSLNLARPLVDGEQVLVGVAPSPSSVAPPPPSAAGASSTGSASAPAAPAALVDLNLAGQALLETLPEVGPVTAAAIIAWREQHGGFTAVTELLEVDGIGDATLAQLTPLVTV